MKYMYYLLKENYETLQNFNMVNEPYKIGNSSTNRGKVINWILTKEALKQIKEVPSIRELCSAFLENEFFAENRDSFYIPYETYLEFNSKYDDLIDRIDAVIDFFEAAGFDSVENGFDIKMPPTEDFAEFAENIATLNKAINQCPYLKSDAERIILKKTDIGSIWFEFAINTTAGMFVLNNLAKIVDKCIKIKSHYITVKQQEEQLRQIQLKNDLLEGIIDRYKEVADELISNCVEELKNEIKDVPINNDDTQRVKYTLENISKLMEKGMEIYASIDSSPEVKDIFPTSDEMKFFSKPQQLLENGEKE